MHSDPHAFEQLAQVLLTSLGGSASQPIAVAIAIALVLRALAPVLTATAKLIDSISGLILALRTLSATPKAKKAPKGAQRSRTKR